MTNNGHETSLGIHSEDNLRDVLDEAIALHDAGDLQGAEPLLRRILRHDPAQQQALYHLGTLELQRENVTAGMALLECAAADSPPIAELFNNLGLGYRAQGNWGDAAQAFERALKIDPQCAAAYFNLGDLSESLGQFGSASKFYRQALQFDPLDTEICLRLARLQLQSEVWDEAELYLARALEHGAGLQDPSFQVELLSQLGTAQAQQRKFAEATNSFEQALALSPNVAELHCNLAYVLERQGRLADAVRFARRAIAIKPDLAEAHNNLGISLRSQHCLEEARAAFQTAIELQPEFHLAQFNLGTTRLMTGDYKNGWPGYEHRVLLQRGPQSQPAGDQPVWNGQPLPERTLLLYTEQGYGDAIQFARFIGRAKSVSQARMILVCAPPLVPLLQHLSGVDVCLASESALPPCDAQLALSSLPAKLDVQLRDVVPDAPYLSTPETLRKRWQATIEHLVATQRSSAAAGSTPAAPATLLKVGIVWRGNPDQDQDHVRSCPLACFEPLTQIPGVRLVSLQKGAASEAELTQWTQRRDIIHIGPLLQDFADTAAAIEALDLVISVDTAVAHLAGALGRPCWTLLCHTPDWRWQLAQPTSPWYPTLKLFRQPAWGDWQSVFAQVTAALGTAVQRLSDAA